MTTRACLRIILLVVVLAAVSPAWADQWYEHYARAEKALLDSDHDTAIAELNQALERRGDSGARVRTYGMRVIDYFPYLKLGIAYFAAGEFEAALRAFDTEEQLGAISAPNRHRGELERFRRRAKRHGESASRSAAGCEQLVDHNLAAAREHQNVPGWKKPWPPSTAPSHSRRTTPMPRHWPPRFASVVTAR